MPGGDDFGTRPIDMHISGLEAMGAEFEYDGGTVMRPREPPPRRRDHVRLPERRGDGEHRDRGGARRRRDRHPQRCPRAGDHRPVRVPERDGRQHRGRRHVARCGSTGSSRARCTGVSTRPCPTASRPRRTSPRAPSPAVSSTCSTRSRSTWRWCCRASATWGMRDRVAAVRAAGRRAGATARRRRGDAAVPGHRHRLQAADHHDADGRRRRRRRDREPLPRSVRATSRNSSGSAPTSRPTATTR